MGWHISCEENTVEISKECAKDLFAAQKYSEEFWYELEEVAYRNKLSFNDDHMEHMDFVWNPHLLAVLQKHKVKGRITFASYEGDNAGRAWGYDFDGEGGVKKLRGHTSVVWE